MAASQNGHVEVVDKLLQHGASVDIQEKVSRNVAFYCSVPNYICTMIF